MNPDTRGKLNELAETSGKEYGKLVQRPWPSPFVRPAQHV